MLPSILLCVLFFCEIEHLNKRGLTAWPKGKRLEMNKCDSVFQLNKALQLNWVCTSIRKLQSRLVVSLTSSTGPNIIRQSHEQISIYAPHELTRIQHTSNHRSAKYANGNADTCRSYESAEYISTRGFNGHARGPDSVRSMKINCMQLHSCDPDSWKHGAESIWLGSGCFGRGSWLGAEQNRHLVFSKSIFI
jgi:hypothetical protein